MAVEQRDPIKKPPLEPPGVIKVAIADLKSKAMGALRLRQEQYSGQTDQELNQSVAEEAIENDLGELLSCEVV